MVKKFKELTGKINHHVKEKQEVIFLQMKIVLNIINLYYKIILLIW
jgi:hypothetical protein